MIDNQIKNWIIKAMEDFNIAKHELSFPEEEVSTGPVCFHCQQVVEKLLKAYLVSKNIDFEKTHDIEYLLELCIKQDPEFERLNVGNLKFYAVEVRYPEEFYIPSVEEVALKVTEFILKKLEIKAHEVKRK